MAEWSIAHAWKACIPQGIGGSNPPLSAIINFSLLFSFIVGVLTYYLIEKPGRKLIYKILR